jgi:protein O-mannosyl-transferase
MDSEHSHLPESGQAVVRRSIRAHRLVPAALWIAAVIPFVRTLGFGFVYDDTWIVQYNREIIGWRSLLTLWRHPYWTDADGARAGLYRPIHTAFFAIIRNGVGGWPLWFHLYALLLHGAVTLLVWRMLSRGVRRWPAALAALWFAVHPIHVEAVANISNTAEPLAALWALGLYFVLARAASSELSWPRTLLAATLFLLAMLSKESGVMSLAIALLAAEAWRPAGETTTLLPAHAPTPPLVLTLWRQWHRLVIASVAMIAVAGTMRWTALGSSLDSASMAAIPIVHMSAAERVWKVISLGPALVSLLAWPRVPNAWYGPSYFPTGARAILAVASTLLALGLAVVGALRLARKSQDHSTRDGRPLAAIGWTLLAYFPASNLLAATGPIIGERTLYLPSIGVAMLLAWGMERLAIAVERGVPRWQLRHDVPRMALVLGCTAWLALAIRFAVLTDRWTSAWSSTRALIDQMIAADSTGYRGHYLLAVELRRGHASDSVAHEFATAYRLYSRDPQVDIDYARFLLERHEPAEAARVARMLMEDSRAHNDAGAIAVYLEARGRAYGADSVLSEASRLYRLQPHPTLALYIGMAHEARAERAAALTAYRDGLRVAPGDSALSARAARLQ